MVFRFLICALAAIALSLSALPADAKAKKAKNTPNLKYSSIVIDAQTGAVLHARSADEPRYPASLTKMMTLLLAFDALESGAITMNSAMKVSKRASLAPPSKLGLKAGGTIRVRDAVMGLITKSANDASVVLAEHIGGSEGAFARQMTSRARALGMNGTTFKNPHGLFDRGQITTARDMAILSQHLIAHYPEYYRLFSTKSFTYNGITHESHNKLAKTFPGMDGLKTGYISQSGFNLAASARQNGRRLIGVVMGGQTSVSRNSHMAELLNGNFSKLRSPQAAQTILASAPRLHITPGRIQPDTIQNADDAITVSVAAQGLDVPARKPQALGAPASVTAAVSAEDLRSRIAPLALREDGDGNVEMAALAAPAGTLGTLIPQAHAATRAQTGTAPANALWGIQIGAFETREATDTALYRAMEKLAPRIRHAQPLVAPMRLKDAKWIFRARLTGLTQQEARDACQHFRDCLPLSPTMF